MGLIKSGAVGFALVPEHRQNLPFSKLPDTWSPLIIGPKREWGAGQRLGVNLFSH